MQTKFLYNVLNDTGGREKYRRNTIFNVVYTHEQTINNVGLIAFTICCVFLMNHLIYTDYFKLFFNRILIFVRLFVCTHN